MTGGEAARFVVRHVLGHADAVATTPLRSVEAEAIADQIHTVLVALGVAPAAATQAIIDVARERMTRQSS